MKVVIFTQKIRKTISHIYTNSFWE